MTVIYCSFCVVDDNLCKLNNWMSWLVYNGYQKLDYFQLFEYWYQESLKI